MACLSQTSSPYRSLLLLEDSFPSLPKQVAQQARERVHYHTRRKPLTVATFSYLPVVRRCRCQLSAGCCYEMRKCYRSGGSSLYNFPQALRELHGTKLCKCLGVTHPCPMRDVFDSLDEPASGAAHDVDDIEAALDAAEQALNLPPGGGSSSAAAAGAAAWGGLQWPGHDLGIPRQHHVWQMNPDGQTGNSNGNNGDAAPSQQPRALAASSLGEASLALRLTVHEKDLELLELRQSHAQLEVGGPWPGLAGSMGGRAWSPR
jgi:hypothetical protein